MKLIKPSTKRLIASIGIITGSVACSYTNIKSPDQLANAETLLVLPVHEINEAHLKQHGFYYIYEIVNIDSFDITHRAVFKLPIKENMLIVDSLPAGNYTVRQFVFKTIGTGDFTYGDNIEERDDRFKLEPGKITIFHQSLDVRLYNKTPGRGMTTNYQFGMNPLTQTKREGIIGTLGALQYLNHWEISPSESPVTAPSKKAGKTAAQLNQTPTAFDVTGTYKSSITGKWRIALALDGPTTEVKLEQKGSEIKGSFGSKGGKIFGHLEGNIVNFNWIGSGTRSGTGEWIFKSESDDIEGNWSTGHGIDMSGRWNLHKTEKINTTSSPSPEFDLSGTYTSKVLRKDNSDYWCFNQKKTFMIKLKQNDNRIKGTFMSGITGGITGKINKNKVVFTWYTARCNAGYEGEWTVGSEGSDLKGFGWSGLVWEAQKNN